MELNTYILDKLGWTPYSLYRGITELKDLPSTPFMEDPLVRYFCHMKGMTTCYILKELDHLEKQKCKSTYKFIVFDYLDLVYKFKVYNVSSNVELFSLISYYNATNNLEYYRHFVINNSIRNYTKKIPNETRT